MSVFFEALSVFCGQEECVGVKKKTKTWKFAGVYCVVMFWSYSAKKIYKIRTTLSWLLHLLQGFGRCTEMTSNWNNEIHWTMFEKSAMFCRCVRKWISLGHPFKVLKEVQSIWWGVSPPPLFFGFLGVRSWGAVWEHGKTTKFQVKMASLLS